MQSELIVGHQTKLMGIRNIVLESDYSQKSNRKSYNLFTRKKRLLHTEK